MFGSILAAHCQIFSSCAHSSGFVFIALVGPSPAIPSLSVKTLSLKVFFVKVLSLMLPPLSRFCAKETPYLSLSKSFKVSQSPPMSQESRVGRNSIKRTENDKCVCVYEKSHWCIALFILIKSFCRISSFFSYISIKPWFHTTRTSTEHHRTRFKFFVESFEFELVLRSGCLADNSASHPSMFGKKKLMRFP